MDNIINKVEDHLDYVFAIMEEEKNKPKVFVCEWDNCHGDMTHFR